MLTGPDGRFVVLMSRSAKAQAAIDGKAPVKRNRFITLTGARKSLNTELEAKARLLAGCGYCARSEPLFRWWVSQCSGDRWATVTVRGGPWRRCWFECVERSSASVPLGHGR